MIKKLNPHDEGELEEEEEGKTQVFLIMCDFQASSVNQEGQ